VKKREQRRSEKKLREDSFAAKLSTPQRDELFHDLAGGLGLVAAAQKSHEWTKAEWGGRPPSRTSVSDWFEGERVRRKYEAAKMAAVVTEANCPADYDAAARRALGQAKFATVLSDLSPMEVAALERNDIAKAKNALLERKVETDVRVARANLTLERARLALTRVKGGERSEDLQTQIDLALEEIEKLKHGDDA
jgi:hypothetical protein